MTTQLIEDTIEYQMNMSFEEIQSQLVHAIRTDNVELKLALAKAMASNLTSFVDYWSDTLDE